MYPDASTTKQTDPLHLDRIDRRILNELMREGRISVTDLAERVGLSRTPCQARLARLQASGAIRGFHAALDPETLGAGLCAFVLVDMAFYMGNIDTSTVHWQASSFTYIAPSFSLQAFVSISIETLPAQLKHWQQEASHGDLPQWQKVLKNLPEVSTNQVDIVSKVAILY